MKPELLPCPFCGGKAEIVDADPKHHELIKVECAYCGASSNSAYTREAETAADAWNRRTPDVVRCGECEYAKDDTAFCKKKRPDLLFEAR